MTYNSAFIAFWIFVIKFLVISNVTQQCGLENLLAINLLLRKKTISGQGTVDSFTETYFMVVTVQDELPMVTGSRYGSKL